MLVWRPSGSGLAAAQGCVTFRPATQPVRSLSEVPAVPEASPVLSERRGRVQLITLNRPDARNSVNRELADAMTGVLEAFDADPEAVGRRAHRGRARGSRPAWTSRPSWPAACRSCPGRGFAGIVEQSCAKPLVAAVEGFALAGGLEIALSCDVMVAAKGARLGIPETGVGLFAGAGALLRLPRQVGYNLAMELALTADPITAERGYELGLVNRLAEPGEAVDVAMELAERIARNAPLGAGRLQAGGAGELGHDRRRLLALPAADPRPDLRLVRRHRGRHRLRREATAQLDRALSRPPQARTSPCTSRRSTTRA